MAGKVSRLSGSVTTDTESPSWLVMMSSWLALVANVISWVRLARRACRTTRCTIDSIVPSSFSRRVRNCLDRALLLRGHRRLPEPPDRSTNCILIYCSLNGEGRNSQSIACEVSKFWALQPAYTLFALYYFQYKKSEV